MHGGGFPARPILTLIKGRIEDMATKTKKSIVKSKAKTTPAKKAPQKTAAKKETIAFEALRAAGQELNVLLFTTDSVVAEDSINLEGDATALAKQIKEASKLVEPGDEISPATKHVLEQLQPSKSARKEPVKKAVKPEPGRQGNAKRKYPDEACIKLTVKTNPKKKGSAAHGRFELYASVGTIGEYLKLGGLRADLSWDVKHGFIEVK